MRETFPHDAAQRFIDSYQPGVRIVRTRRLRGGARSEELARSRIEALLERALKEAELG